MASFSSPMSRKSVCCNMPAVFRRMFHGSVASSSQATPPTSRSMSTLSSSYHPCSTRCFSDEACMARRAGGVWETAVTEGAAWLAAHRRHRRDAKNFPVARCPQVDLGVCGCNQHRLRRERVTRSTRGREGVRGAQRRTRRKRGGCSPRCSVSTAKILLRAGPTINLRYKKST